MVPPKPGPSSCDPPSLCQALQGTDPSTSDRNASVGCMKSDKGKPCIFALCLLCSYCSKHRLQYRRQWCSTVLFFQYSFLFSVPELQSGQRVRVGIMSSFSLMYNCNNVVLCSWEPFRTSNTIKTSEKRDMARTCFYKHIDKKSREEWKEKKLAEDDIIWSLQQWLCTTVMTA